MPLKSERGGILNNDTLMTLLKHDLELLDSSRDAYLNQLLKEAKGLMENEGITFPTVLDEVYGGAIVRYAAFLYRYRANPDFKMPRHLRFSLNQLILKNGGAENV